MQQQAAGASVPRHRLWRRAVYVALAAAWIAMAWWQASKPLPPGARTRSNWYTLPAGDVHFIADVTAGDAYGRRVSSQAIFDETLKIVHQAREILVLDYYLFGGRRVASDEPLRPLSTELRDALIQRRREVPQLRVLFITDPFNELQGEARADLERLRSAGVDVVVTDIERLRDANFMYSSLWRLAIRWWSTGGDGTGWMPNPRDAGTSPVSFGAWARLLNFKANQRRLVLGDDGHGKLLGLVGSADPHDASSTQSNVAVQIAGPAVNSLLESELAIARFSGWKGRLLLPDPAEPADPPGIADDTARVQVLTEGAIGAALIEQLRAAAPGEFVDIVAFCVADRGVIRALLEAAGRGVVIRLILDPGKEAFGKPKSGIPNRSVASELVSASDGAIHVRWYRTHGEQFHPKLVMVHGPKRLWLLGGSADLTRHALDDYNLEADVAIEVPHGAPLAIETLEYFTALWSNRAALGIEYTADFPLYADPAPSHYWLYRFLEGTGWASF
jgi:hypothetical protein